MKKLFLILLLMLSSSVFSEECIKPKYAREALMELRLQQEVPGVNELGIRQRLPDSERSKLGFTLEIYACLSGMGIYCPEEKIKWSRDQHQKNGNLVIKDLKDRRLISVKEAVYLLKLIDYEIQDSLCSDY